MKRTISLSALTCGIMMLLASCAGSAIKMAAEALNNSCPKQVNEIVTMDRASYNDNVMTINYTVDDTAVSIDSLSSVLDLIKNKVMVRFQNSDDMTDFIQTCIEAGAVIQNVYTGKESGESFTIEFNAEDMQNILNRTITPENVCDTEAGQEVEEAAENAVEQGEDIIKEEMQANDAQMQNL